MNTKTQPAASEPSSLNELAEVWSKAMTEYRELLERADADAEKFRVESDMFGWNFHKGLESGAIEMHLILCKVEKAIAALLSSDAKPAGEPAMSAEQINEVNKSLWAELDEIKEKTGYNAYRETNKGVGHWTLLGYLLNLKHRAEASDPVAVPQGWNLVPFIPTPEMVAAALPETKRQEDIIKYAWAAMVCAAPGPAPVGINGLTEDETNASDSLYWRLHSLSKALESSGRIDEHEYPDAYATILDAMLSAAPQPAAQTQEREAGT